MTRELVVLWAIRITALAVFWAIELSLIAVGIKAALMP